MCKLIPFFAIALISFVPLTQAQTVTIELLIDPSGPGTFEVHLSDTLDNDGISSYGVTLLGGVTSIDHNSPQTTLATTPFAGTAGFTFLRSADGIFAPFGASQDVITPTLNLMPGFGQLGGNSGSFVGDGVTHFGSPFILESPTWTDCLLVATGTYTGTAPTVSLAGSSATVFALGALPAVGALGGAILAAPVVVGPCAVGGNTPPSVTNMFVDIPVGSGPFDQQTLATNATPANYQILATDAEDDPNDLTWTLNSFDGPFQADGVTPLPGAGNGNQMLSSSGLFTWNPGTFAETSSGFYFAGVTVTDMGGLTDIGILRVQVPEPSTFILAGLSLVGVFASRRRNS